EVTLKEEALENQRYKDELGAQNRFYNVNGPHYRINVVSGESFIERLNEIEKQLPEDQRIGYTAKNEESWGNWISTFGFLILIFFLFWMMMRRMSGPSGPGGQIFNVGKSRAQLFDAENKVKVTFDNVAGLDERSEEHTSELQSRENLVCRLLLEKKKE